MTFLCCYYLSSTQLPRSISNQVLLRQQQQRNVIFSKTPFAILTKLSVDVRLTQKINNQVSNLGALKILFTKSAVCLQNTFLPITSQPLKTEKIYIAPNVLHPQPVIWYVYIFFIRQLFVYFFAPDVSTAIIRTFQTSFF